MTIVENAGDGSDLRNTIGGAATGSWARTVAMFGPSSGAAKMIPSTRWAMRNSRTGTMSTVSDVSISRRSSAVAGGLRLLRDPVERLGDAEVAQAGDDHAERLRASLDEAAGDGARLEPGLGDGRLDRLAGSRGDTSGRWLITRDTVCVETPHMRAISLMVMPCWGAKLIPRTVGSTCIGAVLMVPYHAL